MNQKYDLAVSPVIEMNQPNEKIVFYSGEYKLKSLIGEEIIVIGEIYFKWFPHSMAEFIGEIKNHTKSKFLLDSDEFILTIDNKLTEKCYILSNEINDKHLIKGVFQSKVIFGDNTLTSKRFKFSLVNFEDFFGDHIYYSGQKYSRARIAIKNEKFEISIDKIFDFKIKLKQLKENGGYQILLNGEINILKNSFTYQQIQDLMNLLGNFLSFINGKKNNPLFLTAIHEDKILYQDLSGYHNKSYEYHQSWCDTYSTSYINDLFSNFYDIWKSNDDNKFFLNSCIHWYTEINCNSGYSEGSLIMAQTALELLYNWLIVEKKKLIIGKDSENISASNKIRLLLSQLSISNTIPEKFKNLEKFKIDSKSIDAIETIVQIRNAIIHSQEEKRKKLSEIPTIVIYEAVQLSIWYIEMSLLYILNFRSKYSNRCSVDLDNNSKLELPPWI